MVGVSAPPGCLQHSRCEPSLFKVPVYFTARAKLRKCLIKIARGRKRAPVPGAEVGSGWIFLLIKGKNRLGSFRTEGRRGTGRCWQLPASWGGRHSGIFWGALGKQGLGNSLKVFLGPESHLSAPLLMPHPSRCRLRCPSEGYR